jgi:hypothetical protein
MGSDAEKALIGAAESYLTAVGALQEAKDALDDQRLAAEAALDQAEGSAAAASRAEQALKRGSDALGKPTVAAAAARLPGAHGLYLRGKAALDEAGQAVRSAPGRDSTRAKVRELERGLMRLYAALDTVKDLVFAPGPTDWDAEP